MGIVEEYWSGVLDRLQAEVDILARLVKHSGEMGREHEVALQRLLERLLPTQYGLGTGLIIDSLNNYSRQADIVVYDQHTQPRLLFQTTPLLYPVETVRACFEVKAVIRSKDVADIRAKARSLRSLVFDEGPFEFPRPVGEYLQPILRLVTPPYFFVLAYNAEGLSDQTLIRRFVEAGGDEMPDRLLILKRGLLAHKSQYPQQGRFEFEGGIVFQHKRDRAGQRIPVAEPTPPEPALPPDPARALLLFLRDVTHKIGRKAMYPFPLLDTYLRDHKEGVDLFSQIQPIPKPSE